jgi:isoquinoline 1-oxidoreductase beta subunit
MLDQNISRRTFVRVSTTVAGGLAVGAFVGCAETTPPTGPRTVSRLDPWEQTGGNEVGAWLVIEPDDSIVIRVAQSEMGEGVFTSMPMLIAEELQCDWSKVRAEYASANRNLREERIYGRMATGGSGAVRRSRQYLQQAGASARERLVQAAAEKFGVPVEECRAQNGRVRHDGTGMSAGFGELAGAAAGVTLDREPAVKTPAEFTFLGTPTPRLDVPAKVTGSATFGIDVRVPGMLYASISQCPVFGGKLKSHDFDAIRGRAGVVKAVAFDDAVAVVADTFWHAKTALDAMPIEWDLGENASASSAELMAEFKADLEKPGAVAAEAGDTDAALAEAAKVVEAVYEVPYLAHATMEPLNCTAHVQANRVDVWLGTQGPERVLAAAAEITGLDPENVYVHNCFLGGGFGRRSSPDEARQAVTISKELGKPVQLIWTREQDIQHDRYRPMAALRFKAGLDDEGNATAFFNTSATHSIIASFRPQAAASGLDRTSLELLENLAYGIPNHRIEHHLKLTHVPVWFWRSVGASQNGFALESFVDEMAHAAGRDPLQFRRELLLEHADYGHVLDVLERESDWGTPLPEGTARGVAITESFGTVVGQVAEVSVTKSGEAKVNRVVCAVDCGNVVNPLTLEEQVESSIVYGLTAAFYGKLTIEQGRVLEGNFDTYPMLRMAEMPKVETHLALTGGDKWGGMGEPAVPPIAPAVCNAIFAITGKRVRSLPLAGQDLSWG